MLTFISTIVRVRSRLREGTASGPTRKMSNAETKSVNIHATTQLQVVLVKPERFDDASSVADHLNDKRTVVLNRVHQ